MEQKKHRQTSKKKRNLTPIYTVFIGLAAIVTLLFTVGPFKNDPNTATPPADPTTEEPNTTTDSYREVYESLFKPDGTIAHFLGDGIEYATYVEKTTWVQNDYVILRVDNGGATTDEVYRISDDKLSIVYFDIVEDNEQQYSIAELEAMPELEVVFEGPIQDGETPNGNTITTNVTFETPYKTFNDAIVVKDTSEDATNETVYVPGYGIVGKVFISSDGYKVTSLLNTVRNISDLTDDEGSIAVYNKSTEKTENIQLTGLNFIDPTVHSETDLLMMNIQYEKLANTASGELGMLTYLCDQYDCNYSIVVKRGQEANTQLSSEGEVKSVHSIPGGRYVALELSVKELQDEETYIERNSIFLFDVENEEITLPSGAERDHFESPMWPIRNIELSDKGILSYSVADIPNVEFDTIYNWQNSEQQAVKNFSVDLNNLKEVR